MKKVFVLIMAVAVSASAFSITNKEYKIFQKLNNQSTLNGLVRYLDADLMQSSQLEYVFSLTEEKLRSAINSGNESKLEKAIRFNLANVKAILSEEQYKQYLLVLNATKNYMQDDMMVEAL